MMACPGCNSTNSDVENGMTICTDCGCILSTNQLVADDAFQQNGTNYSDQHKYYCQIENKAIANVFDKRSTPLAKLCRKRLRRLSSALKFTKTMIDDAFMLWDKLYQEEYKISHLTKKFLAVDCCVYYIARMQNWLISLADVGLGKQQRDIMTVFGTLEKVTTIKLPYLDISDIIEPMCEGASMSKQVTNNTKKLITALKDMFISQGRKPAMLIAVIMYLSWQAESPGDRIKIPFKTFCIMYKLESYSGRYGGTRVKEMTKMLMGLAEELPWVNSKKMDKAAMIAHLPDICTHHKVLLFDKLHKLKSEFSEEKIKECLENETENEPSRGGDQTVSTVENENTEGTKFDQSDNTSTNHQIIDSDGFDKTKSTEANETGEMVSSVSVHVNDQIVLGKNTKSSKCDQSDNHTVDGMNVHIDNQTTSNVECDQLSAIDSNTDDVVMDVGDQYKTHVETVNVNFSQFSSMKETTCTDQMVDPLSSYPKLAVEIPLNPRAGWPSTSGYNSNTMLDPPPTKYGANSGTSSLTEQTDASKFSSYTPTKYSKQAQVKRGVIHCVQPANAFDSSIKTPIVRIVSSEEDPTVQIITDGEVKVSDISTSRSKSPDMNIVTRKTKPNQDDMNLFYQKYLTNCSKIKQEVKEVKEYEPLSVQELVRLDDPNLSSADLTESESREYLMSKKEMLERKMLCNNAERLAEPVRTQSEKSLKRKMTKEEYAIIGNNLLQKHVKSESNLKLVNTETVTSKDKSENKTKRVKVEFY